MKIDLVFSAVLEDGTSCTRPATTHDGLCAECWNRLFTFEPEPESEPAFSIDHKRKQARKCGLCRKSGHLTAECSLKKQPHQKVCPVCANLPHRVLGPKCRACGLRYANEEPVTLAYIASLPQPNRTLWPDSKGLLWTSERRRRR